MNCPSCPGELTEVHYEGERIYTCTSCNGVMLDEEKLKKIELNRQTRISRDQGHANSRHYEGTRLCPDCDTRMEKSKYGKYFPLTIDKCPQCSNIWLDKGELEDIQVAFEVFEENTNRVK